LFADLDLNAGAQGIEARAQRATAVRRACVQVCIRIHPHIDFLGLLGHFRANWEEDRKWARSSKDVAAPVIRGEDVDLDPDSKDYLSKEVCDDQSGLLDSPQWHSHNALLVFNFSGFPHRPPSTTSHA
jgi:hypothetical protein